MCHHINSYLVLLDFPLNKYFCSAYPKATRERQRNVFCCGLWSNCRRKLNNISRGFVHSDGFFFNNRYFLCLEVLVCLLTDDNNKPQIRGAPCETHGKIFELCSNWQLMSSYVTNILGKQYGRKYLWSTVTNC